MQGPAAGVYFTRYSENTAAWTARAGLAEGRPVVVIADPALGREYVVRLEWRGDQIAAIHDYRYAPYVAELVTLEALG
jgi:RNA polymerase sigma-70 factor (ECF subfamily)